MKVIFLFNARLKYHLTYFIFAAAEARPHSVELFSPAEFKVGDIVLSVPDTDAGVHPRHSVTITGPHCRAQI